MNKENNKSRFFNNPFWFIENLSEQDKIEAITADPAQIMLIKDPSEAIQLAAVGAGSAICMIKNPTEKVQLSAIDLHVNNIFFIKDPSEVVQLAAVNKIPQSIQFTENPTEAVQLAVVMKSKRTSSPVILTACKAFD